MIHKFLWEFAPCISFQILLSLGYIFTSKHRSTKRKVQSTEQRVSSDGELMGISTDLNTLKYVEPPPMGSAEEGKLITTTVHSYDRQQLRGMYKSLLMGVGMMGVMHLYMKYTNPLLVQSIIPLKGAFEGNLTKIHIMGQPAIGDLKRPWKAAGGLMGMGGAGDPKADKKSIEQAEKAGSGGVKDE